MYNKTWWIFPLMAFGIEFGLFWIIGVAFMEYGICWRTIAATIVMVLFRIGIRVYSEISRIKWGRVKK